MKRAKEKLPSVSDITKADDIELIELSRESSRVSENLILDMKDTQTQTDDSLPMRKLLGLDKQLRSIRGSLKVEVAKKVQLEEHINNINNKKRSHTQLDSRKQVIAFQDRVITINIKEAQHPLKREKQVIDKSSIILKISTKSMHQVLV